MIRVLLVDDDAACRECLRQVVSLAPDMQVVGEACDVGEAFRLGRELRPDVVLVDADLPGAACPDMIKAIASAGSASPSFVCLAIYPDNHEAALRAGALSFLRKDSSPREILTAVRESARRPSM